MENRNEMASEKRKRKVTYRPVLVRSEKPGQVASASYGRLHTPLPFWKAE